MLNDGEKGVIIQRDKETYAIAPHLPCGIVTPEILRKVADVAEKYKVQAIKVTSAARIALIGVKEEDGDQVGDAVEGAFPQAFPLECSLVFGATLRHGPRGFTLGTHPPPSQLR